MGAPRKPAAMRPRLRRVPIGLSVCCMRSQDKGHAFCGKCGTKLRHVQCDGLRVTRSSTFDARYEVDILGAATVGQATRLASLALAMHFGVSCLVIERCLAADPRMDADDIAGYRQTVVFTAR